MAGRRRKYSKKPHQPKYQHRRKASSTTTCSLTSTTSNNSLPLTPLPHHHLQFAHHQFQQHSHTSPPFHHQIIPTQLPYPSIPPGRNQPFSFSESTIRRQPCLPTPHNTSIYTSYSKTKSTQTYPLPYYKAISETLDRTVFLRDAGREGERWGGGKEVDKRRERKEREREGQEKWDVNAYFAPLREEKKKGDTGVEGKEGRRDEWECEFCGGECFWRDENKNRDGVEEKDMLV